jgi:serine/threonine-protein kinase/endoribonuclease IRE1
VHFVPRRSCVLPCLPNLASQAQLLSPDPARRPSAAASLAHPFWWPPETRLSFLVDVSERVELEDREQDRSLLAALEARGAAAALGFPWDAALHPELLDNLSRYRRYNAHSVRDLLRVVRNKRAHWRELPPAARSVLGPPPGPFLAYWTHRFPGLLMHVHAFAAARCAGDPHLRRYFPRDDAAATAEFERMRSDDGAAAELAAAAAAEDAATAEAAAAATATVFPERPGEPECTFYMKTGRCKFAERCVFHHPPPRAHSLAAAAPRAAAAPWTRG